MQKYIVIDIKSAKFPLPNGKNPDDYISSHQGDGTVKERTLDQCVAIPEKETDLITKHQVSAMLHVMLNARPVSYVHGSSYKSCEVIDKLADKALVKANNCFCYKTSKGNNAVYAEFTQSNKSHWNSKKKGVVTFDEDGNVYDGKFTWDAFKRHYYYGKDARKYTETMSFLKNICDDHSMFDKYEFIDFIKKLAEDDSKKVELIKYFGSLDGGTPVVKIINGEKTDAGFEGSPGTNYNLAAQTNVRGVKRKVTLDATILVPVSDEMANDFIHGKRYATFGDGGFAYLKEVKLYDEDELIDDENFIYINN